MRMSAEHRQMLRDCIAPLNTRQAREAYRTGNFRRANETKDVNKRYRWDLFWAANTSYPHSMQAILDADYTDAHIDTALRSIVPDVKETSNA